MRYGLLLLLLVAALSAFSQGGVALPEEVYSTPGPHVVVNGVLLQAPVKEVNGSLLLPMRAVFEALQAQVSWYPATQQIIATRGTTTVQLWINRSVAMVNEQQLTMAVPPKLMAGSTYVPLRFPAEAFGGDVKWFSALQTAAITITPWQEAPAPPPPGVLNPEHPTTLNGVLMTKVTTGVRALLVQLANDDTTLVQMAPAVLITRANGNQAPQAASFAALEPGDQLQITRDVTGKATAIVARFAQISGIAAAIANNKLLLQDGSLYQLQADIQVVNTAGQAVPLTQVTNGTAVTLDLTPDTTDIWRITVPEQMEQPPITPPIEQAPNILTVAAANYTKALKAGDTLTIRVTGEPNADRVTASIGNVIRDVRLDERAPGVYTRTVTIEPNTNVTKARIVAQMRLNGQDSPAVESTLRVTIDTRPPSFTALIPGDETELLERNPTLEAAYTDRGGSGVDTESVQLFVNGTDVTRRATITNTRVSYNAQRLPLGQVVARVEVADLAGNIASAEWTMTIAEATTTVTQYVKHDATRPLRAGQRLNLVGKFADTPSKLEWYLGNTLISTAMVKDAASDEYRTSYSIDPEDALGEYSVSVRVYTATHQSQVLFAATPVRVVAQATTFTITSPRDQTKAPVPLVVTGRATPGVQVRVTVVYSGQALFVKVKGEQLYRAILTADTRGVWETPPIDTDALLVKIDTYTIIADLLDDHENVSNTKTITLTRR